MAKRNMTLRGSQEAFKTIVDTSLEGIYQVDNSGKFIFVNESFASLFGYGREELLGTHIKDMLNAETLSKVEKMVQKVLSGKDVHDEVTAKHKDGHEIQVNFSATPLREQGEVVGLTGILSDITERKQAEEKLRESEAKWRSLVENAPERIVTLDRDGTILFINRTSPGYVVEEVIGTSVYGYLPTDEQQIVRKAVEVVFESGESRKHVGCTVIPDGTTLWFESSVAPIWSGDRVTAAIYVLADITERKQAEEMLRESEGKWRSLVENVPETILTLDRDGTILFINRTLPGRTPEGLTGTSVCSYMTADGQKRIRKVIESVFQSGESQKYEADVASPDGRLLWFENSVAPIWSGDQVVSVIYVSVDVTERKQAEEELRRKEEYYHALIENSLDAISVLDADGIMRYESPSYKRVLGYKPEEEIGKSGFEYVHQDDMQRATSAFARLFQTPGLILHEEVRVWHKDGSLHTIEVVAQNLLDNPAVEGIVANYRDITEHKQAEEVLREAHDQLGMLVKERTLELEKANEALQVEMGEHRRAEEAAKGITREFLTILENSVDMIYRLNLQSGTYDYLSPSSEIVLGYTPEEFIASGFENASTLVHPDDLEMLSQNILELIERAPEQTATGPIEYRMNHKQLGYRWVSDNRSIIYDDRNMPVAAIGILRDVTERKQAEQALQESERNYRVLFDSQIDGAAVVDAEKMKIVLVNETALKMYGFDSLEEALEVNLIDYIHPDDRDRILRIITEDMFEKDLRQVVEFRIITKDGRERWASAVGTRIEYKGKMAGLASFRDITEQKRAEEALRESEIKFREMADLLPQTVLEIDKTGTLTFLNRMGFEASGYSQADFDKGLNSFKLLVPEDRERGKENLQLILNGEESIGTEYTALRKDGTTFPAILYSSPIIRDKQPAGLRAVAVDITERKQAEEALRESEEKGRALLNAPPDSAILTDREGVILDLNKVAADRFGKSRDELIGVCVHDIVPPDVAKGRRAQARKVISSGMPARFEDERAGIIFDSTYYPIFDARGRVTRIAIFARDKTERKKAEQAIHESEQKYRELADLLPQIVFETDAKGNFTFANRNAFKSTGYTPDDLEKGLNVFKVFVPEDRDRSEKNIQRILGGEKLGGNEYTLLRKDGSTFPVIVFSSPIIRENKPEGLRGVVIDVTERKQAEEELRKREEYFRALIENSLDVVAILNADGTIRYQSPSFERILGYEEGVQVGESGFERVHPDDLTKVAEDFAELIKNPDYIVRTEIRYPHKDGSWRVIAATGQNLLDNPAVAGIVCNFRDITERKQAEEKLRMSEHKFKDLTETTPDWVWEIDENGVYTYVSPNIEQLLGYKVNEVLGKTPFDLMPREEAKKIGKTFKEIVIKRGQIYRLENINRHRDGHLVVLETNGIPFFDKEGVFKGYRGTDRDITERKQAEEALREREEHFKALIENSTEAIAIIDGEGAIQYLGPSFESLMGYELEEYLGKNPFDHVHSDDRSRVAAIFAELMQKPGATVQEEVRVLHKNGSLRTVEVVGQNLLHNPAVGGIVANMRDITERKQAAEKLQVLYQQEKDLREQIEKEMKRRVEFTRVLAHELKTPLTSVLASSDLLVSEVRDEPLLSLAKNIRQGASNLNSRIDELLDLARGEVGMLQLKREPVDLSHLLREAADSMTPLALGRGQSIILRLPPALPTVQADTTRLQQIVTNLLNNAVKFTPKGGNITLRARKKDASVIVEVQDTGRGIPKREQERLFEPYQRLEEAEENLSGLGLGLSLCKTLVELHGGQIWMRSHVGRGSTFGFSLPLEAADKQATEPEKIAKLWKVLIIEDDQQIVDSVSLTFRLRWPEVQLISTGLGEEGIEMAETEAPDIVILDLGLPDISGFDVLRQIRLFSSVPVVILTVREDESDMVKGLEWGADDYLVKPFKQLELLARLKVQLRKQTPPDEEAPIVCGPLRLEPSTFQLTHGGKEISLTIIEGRIIECLMRNAGHVVTHSRLAETVWGEDYPRALDSLRVYIRYLREKIEANPSKPKIILTKAGVGYSLVKPV